MSQEAMDLFHERLIEKVDALHSSVQRPINSWYDIAKLADQAKEIHSMLARAVNVKVLDELSDVT